MSDPTLRGIFVWHELMTTDVKSAAVFYSKMTGWKAQTSPQDPSYTLFLSGKQQVAGLMTLPPDAAAMGAPPSWLVYIGTADADGTVREAVSLGGKVLKAPADIPTVGRFAVLQDPQGAAFAVFTPVPGAQATAPPESAYSWHELVTTDYRAALTFYQRLFGWEQLQAQDMGPAVGLYQMYGWGGKAVGGMFNQPKGMAGPPSWIPYIRVADAKRVAATVKTLHGQIVNGPMEVPGGDWIAQGVDLQGAFFAVHSAKSVAAAKKKPAKAKPPARRAAAKPKRAARAKAKPKKTAKRAAKAAPRRRAKSKKKTASRKRR